MDKELSNAWKRGIWALMLVSSSAFGQALPNDQAWPNEPWAQPDQNSSAYPLDLDMDHGFPPDPFSSNPNSGEGDQTEENQGEGLLRSGTTARTAAGEVGQRQTAADIAPQSSPLDRIDNRIDNRVENRLRNRVDRNYAPTANVTSPFKDAQRRNQDSGQPR